MTPRTVVIDTQSLLDWLVFRDPACTDWSSRLRSPGWKWIFTLPMKAEFDHVAAKGFGPNWTTPAPAELDAAWTSLATRHEVPAEPGATARLRCTDPDDQKFIDFAIAAGAHTLVSRDKALLKLARKAAERHGLRICTPAGWIASLPPVP